MRLVIERRGVGHASIGERTATWEDTPLITPQHMQARLTEVEVRQELGRLYRETAGYGGEALLHECRGNAEK